MTEPAFDTDHIKRLLCPREWADNVLSAAAAGWPLPPSTRDIAARIAAAPESNDIGDNDD